MPFSEDLEQYRSHNYAVTPFVLFVSFVVKLLCALLQKAKYPDRSAYNVGYSPLQSCSASNGPRQMG